MASSIIHNGQNRQLRSIVDLVFKPLVEGMSSMSSWMDSYVTKYFLMFIQGITLFASDGDNVGRSIGRPAYHRLASCGPHNADRTYDNDNLNCDGVDVDIVELQHRRRNSWNCFIERKIYQEMYMRIRNIIEQDFGHRFRMRHVEQRLFQSCFPLLHVSMGAINITWSADMIPIEMKMAYKVRLPHPSTGTDGAFHTVVETYKRTFVQAGYELDVSCEKVVVSPNLQHESFFKRQNFFEKNEVWCQLSW
jgi:hypothetical protein